MLKQWFGAGQPPIPNPQSLSHVSDKEAAANALADCKKNDKAGSQGPRKEDEGDGQAAKGGKVRNASDDGDKCKCRGGQRCGAAGGGGGEVVVRAKTVTKMQRWSGGGFT